MRALEKDRLTLSQKGDRIRRLLMGKRFPRLISREEKFSRLKKKLSLPGKVDLYPPPFFEGGTYCMRIEFESAEDLEKAADRVKRLAGSSPMKQLLEEEQ